MREQFRAYYRPTAEEYERLWNDAVIVFDANALLNLFRYSATTRDEWLRLLSKEQGRLWLPYQVALEFHRTRRLIAHQQEKAFAEVETALRSAEKLVRGAIDGLRRHPTLEAEELSQLIERHMKRIRKKFKRARSRHFQAVISQEAHEKTLDSISTLYEGKIGPAYTDEQLKSLFDEGKERYDKKMPPGYMDSDKEGDDKYGDLVLWRQILDYAREAKKPLIFVTEDAKEDWWLRSNGKTFGPRPELVADYFEVTGERAHFYQPREFLKFANERGEKFSAEAIAEARSVSSVLDSKTAYHTEAIRGAIDHFVRNNAVRGLDVFGDATRADLAEFNRFIQSSEVSSESLARIRDAIAGMTAATSWVSAFRELSEEQQRRNSLYWRAVGDRISADSHLTSLDAREDEKDDVDPLGGDHEQDEGEAT